MDAAYGVDGRVALRGAAFRPGCFLMIIGLPREVKDNEYRVGLVPAGIKALKQAGHAAIIETGAGEGSGIFDDEYAAAGATIVQSASEVWSRAEMVVKVKEPVPQEYRFLREGLILFTYLHLARDQTS